MLTLSFDTSAAHCAVALTNGDQVLAAFTEALKKGQAERLFPMLEDLLDQAGTTWSDLDRIGVGIGPGNFTGIRIAISAARGLALSLDCPAIGVSTFAVIHHLNPTKAAAVPAPRGMAYVLPCPTSTAEFLPLESLDAAALPPDPTDWAIAIARIAARADPETTPPPAPLYLRPADAAPPRDLPPTIIP